MGDRTSMTIRIHPAHVDRAKDLLEEEYADGGYDDGVYTLSEMNYGGSSDFLPALVEAGVTFVGHHGSGAEYSAAVFHYDAATEEPDDVVHDRGGSYPYFCRFVTAAEDGTPVVEVGPGGVVDPQGIEDAKRYHEADAAMGAAWDAAAKHEPGELPLTSDAPTHCRVCGLNVKGSPNECPGCGATDWREEGRS